MPDPHQQRVTAWPAGGPAAGTSPRRLWQAFAVTGMGQRIATLRRRKGLSQKTLAGLVGRSESWLSQVERGQREVGRLTDIHQLATSLGVPAETIVGTPTPAKSHHRPTDEDTLTALADPVRRHLDLGPFIQPEHPAIPADTIADTVARANAAYQGADYAAAFELLPSLLAAVDELGRDVPDWAPLTTHAWIVAAKALHKVGENRLSALAADRAAQAARHSTLANQGFAARQVAENRMRAGDLATAETLTIDTAHRIERESPSESSPSSPETISAQGALWLLGAVIAARRTDRFEALDRIDRAETLAQILGHDANHGWSAFGPTNVAIHAVSVAAELGDAGEALHVSRTVDPDHLPAGLISRRAQLHLDLAWALTAQRRDSDAIVHLLDAQDIAPNLVAVHPRVRQAITDLLARTRPNAGGERQLRRLARNAGLL